MVDNNAPVEEKKPNMVNDALAAAASLRLENERMEKNIKELNELKSFEALGGKTDGAKQVEAIKEVSAKDYAKDVLAGKIKFK